MYLQDVSRQGFLRRQFLITDVTLVTAVDVVLFAVLIWAILKLQIWHGYEIQKVVVDALTTTS